MSPVITVSLAVISNPDIVHKMDIAVYHQGMFGKRTTEGWRIMKIGVKQHKYVEAYWKQPTSGNKVKA